MALLRAAIAAIACGVLLASVASVLGARARASHGPLVELTAETHPRLKRLVDAIGDAHVTLRVRRIASIVRGVERDGLLCGSGVGTPTGRNALADAARAERDAIAARASELLLAERDEAYHDELLAAVRALDRALVAQLRRIATGCAEQRTRLNLPPTEAYDGYHSREFELVGVK